MLSKKSLVFAAVAATVVSSAANAVDLGNGLSIGGRLHSELKYESTEKNKSVKDSSLSFDAARRARVNVGYDSKFLSANFEVQNNGNKYLYKVDSSQVEGKNGITIEEAWAGFKLGEGLGQIKFGRQYVTSSYNSLLSSNIGALNGGGIGVGFNEGYGNGIQYALEGDNFNVYLGVFNNEGEAFFKDSESDDTETSSSTYTALFTFAPVKDRDNTLHTGLGFNYSSFNKEDKSSGTKSEDGSTLNVNFSLGYQFSSIYAVYDFNYTNYDIPVSSNYYVPTDEDTQQHSVELVWTLTGEKFGYYGGFGGLTPDAPLSKGGSGAFYLALNYEYNTNYTLKDNLLTNNKTVITDLSSNTFGVTFGWAPEANARVVLSYGYNSVEDDAKSSNTFALNTRVFF
jgi:phosphate-selective porin